jgi:hypothetical protein
MNTSPLPLSVNASPLPLSVNASPLPLSRGRGVKPLIYNLILPLLTPGEGGGGDEANKPGRRG